MPENIIALTGISFRAEGQVVCTCFSTHFEEYFWAMV